MTPTLSAPAGYESLASQAGGVNIDRVLDKTYADIFRDMLAGVALAAREALDALEQVYHECSAENWDGYGAKAVSHSTYVQAQQFLQALPMTFPAPEVGADPDGEICFGWYQGPRRTLSVSVGSTNKVSWAALYGVDSVYGTAHFEDDLPDQIAYQLWLLLAH